MGISSGPDRYYDSLLERRGRPGWRRILRYFLAVAGFLIFITIALSAYWIWQDYAAPGAPGITWQNFKGRAVYHWQQLEQGRLGL